ncbi:NADH dehydrogenase (ubiquinone) 1 beta subcomplex subunit 7, partial [Paragonimus westermani]
VSEEEMLAVGLKPHERDYCAHVLMAYRKCRAENVFAVVACAELRHRNLRCHQADQLLRRKEYERERRLLARQRAEV